MRRWDDVEQTLVELAECELRAGCEVVTPCLVAFAGELPRFMAFVRKFEPGGYVKPLTELLALAAPLDADRLALSISGRAWSLDDPIPPVTEDADLRQRVLCMELLDGSGGRPRRTSVVLPYEGSSGGDDGVNWGSRQVLPGGKGWIGDALTFAVTAEARRRLRAPVEEVARQAARVVALGHQLLLADDVAQHLGLRTFPA